MIFICKQQSVSKSCGSSEVLKKTNCRSFKQKLVADGNRARGRLLLGRDKAQSGLLLDKVATIGELPSSARMLKHHARIYLKGPT